MYLLFLDESGHLPKPANATGQYLVLGGVVMSVALWPKLKTDLDALKSKHGVQGELKWKFFGTGSNRSDNSLLTLNKQERDALREGAFDLLNKHQDITLLACVTSIEAAYKIPSVRDQDDIYNLAYKGLIEQFQVFLQNQSHVDGSTRLGLIIADHRMNHNDERLRARHHELVDGTDQFTGRFDNIVETILFSPSHRSPGLQLADMVAGAVHRAYQHREIRFARKLKPAFRRNQSGRILGHGLIKLPMKGPEAS